MKNRWLDRAIHISAVWFTLCTTEKQFYAECKKFKLPRNEWPSFVRNAHSDATTHFLLHGETGRHAALVCVPVKEGKTGIQMAALLVHEAVHVWQHHLECIGEEKPSCEFEAYGIQSLVQELLTEYHRQVSR